MIKRQNILLRTAAPVVLLLILLAVNIGCKFILTDAHSDKSATSCIDHSIDVLKKDPSAIFLPMSCAGRFFYAPTALVPVAGLKYLVGFDNAYIILNTVFLFTLMLCSFYCLRSVQFTLLVACFWIFNEPLIHIFYIGNLLAGYVYLTYLALNIFLFIRCLRVDFSSKWKLAYFGLSFILLLFSWEHAANYVFFLISLFLVCLLLRDDILPRKSFYAFLSIVAVVVCVFALYVYIRMQHVGDILVRGSEDETILTSLSSWLAVEDVFSNMVTYIYMSISYVVPIVFTQSNALVLLGKEAIISDQNGFIPLQSHLAYFHSIFFWQYIGGAVFALYILFLFHTYLAARKMKSLDCFILFSLALMIFMGSLLHMSVKFRSYLSIPFLSYKGSTSIFAVSLLVAYGIYLIGKNKPRTSYLLTFMMIVCFMVNGLLRPRIYNKLSDAVWASVNYPDPISWFQKRLPTSLFFLFTDNAKLTRHAANTLTELSALFQEAKQSGHSLEDITGQNCSDCPCRGGIQLRHLESTSVCYAQWEHAVTNLFQILHRNGPIPSKYLRDPWHSPYGLDENAKLLRSAGPDGIINTPDDILVTIPPERKDP
jgi:hypothetical protein